MSGKCPVEGCPAPVRAGHLMCLGHWKSVPRVEQRAVNKAWREYRQAPEAYITARAAAIRSAEKFDTQQKDMF